MQDIHLNISYRYLYIFTNIMQQNQHLEETLEYVLRYL